MQCRYLPSKGKNLRRERLAVCKGKDFAKGGRKYIHVHFLPPWAKLAKPKLSIDTI